MHTFSRLFSYLKIAKLYSNCVLCGGSANSLSSATESASTESATAQSEEMKSSFRPVNTINQPIICHHCHERLPVSKDACFSCGLPMPIRENASHSDACGECLANSAVFNRVISAFHYEPPISDFITQLKFSAKFELLPLLSDYLTKAILDSYSDNELPSAVIPVPLHPKKLSGRGFNQSNLLANRISKQLEIPMLLKGINRCKETLPQSDLDSKERKDNMKNSFEILSNCPEHVAVVDDVVTTGATVSELTLQLLSNGAKKVDIWCVARAYDL